MPADFGTVEDRSFVISNFRLQNGAVMPQAKIVYETDGRLAADRRNAVLIGHGHTSSHHAVGRNSANGNLPGWWDGLIGSGKVIDTDRLSAASSNIARFVLWLEQRREHRPANRQALQTRFPAITMRGIVAAERALLGALGVKHLVAVAGPSYCGCQAFQWAVDYPEFMDCVVPVVTAPRRRMSSRARPSSRLAQFLEPLMAKLG